MRYSTGREPGYFEAATADHAQSQAGLPMVSPLGSPGGGGREAPARASSHSDAMIRSSSFSRGPAVSPGGSPVRPSTGAAMLAASPVRPSSEPRTPPPPPINQRSARQPGATSRTGHRRTMTAVPAQSAARRFVHSCIASPQPLHPGPQRLLQRLQRLLRSYGERIGNTSKGCTDFD